MKSRKTKTTARKAAPKAKATKRAKAAAATATKRSAKPAATVTASAKPGTKTAQLVAMLTKGATAEAMMKALGWMPHTLRGAISTFARKTKVTVERTRADGVTSYKLAAGRSQ